MLISVRATLQRPGDRAVPHFSGMTSITLDRARVLANQISASFMMTTVSPLEP